MRLYSFYIFYLLAFCLIVSCQQTETKRSAIHLSSFGAIADDGEDDSRAFKLALDECRKNPGSTLYISSGDYHIRNSEALDIEYKAISGQSGDDIESHLVKPNTKFVVALNMDNFQNITIEAKGVTLIQEGWYQTISIINAKNVTVKGLTLMHKRSPFTIGKIITSTSDYFDMEIDILKYPYLTKNITGRVHFFDTEKQNSYTGKYGYKKLIGSQVIRVESDAAPKLGDLCILKHSGHESASILIKESSDIVLQDVIIHSQPGIGIVGHRSENITMKNLKVIPVPGTITSTNTDATHFTSCKGNILFDACKFAGQGDACTNIHNYYWNVYKEENNKVRIAVENAELYALSLDYPDAGDTLALVSKKNLSTVDYYIVNKVETSLENWSVVLILNKTIDHDFNKCYLTNLSRQPSVSIVNNVVGNHTAHAFIIKTKNVYIAGNTIQSSSGTAIQLGAEADWRESGPVQNIMIENNWIIGCGYGHNTRKGSAITAEIKCADEKTSYLNKNITIRNNIIEATNQNAIYISGTEEIKITDNKIEGSKNAIMIENSKHVELRNNGSLPVIIKGLQRNK